MFRKMVCLIAGVSMLGLAGCASPGVEDRADVYTAGQVNRVQEVARFNILQVRPVRIQVDNSRGQGTAEMIGGLVGAGLGVGLGLGVGNSGLAAGLGGLGGTIAGSMAGSTVVGNTTLVNGVTIVFESVHQRVYSSTQVGKTCEYQVGPALAVATGPGSLRIQPNATCPKG